MLARSVKVVLPALRLALLTMQALRYGQTIPTMESAISGPLDAFSMKWRLSDLLSQPLTFIPSKKKSMQAFTIESRRTTLKTFRALSDFA